MDVTYYVALPFVLADDGLALGEAVECTSANAASCGPRRSCGRPAAPAHLRSAGRQRRVRRRQGHKERRRLPEDLSALRPAKLDWVRNEITRMRGQLRAQEREIRMLRRAGMSTASAELLLS